MTQLPSIPFENRSSKSGVGRTSADPGGWAVPVLRQATSKEYGAYALQTQHNEFWWYFNGLAPWQGYSKPFDDESGRWWYRVKPAFAWPVSFFDALSTPPKTSEFRKLLGWQYPVAPGSEENSLVRMNVIENLPEYELGCVHESKRRAVRKGIKNLIATVVEPGDERVSQAAHEVWKSHVLRTGWNKAMPQSHFVASWKELSAWPGTTVIVVRKPDDELICGWLIARVIDGCLYIDTLASHTERLENRPNDFIAYAALIAARNQGVSRAHYSLASDKTSLESFKQSLGFVAKAFPARLRLRPGVGLALRMLRPRIYRRLQGLDQPEPIPLPPVSDDSSSHDSQAG